MSEGGGIPKEIERALRLHRRDFLKSAGMLAVSVSACAAGWATDAGARARPRYRDPVRTRIPISARSTPGS